MRSEPADFSPQRPDFAPRRQRSGTFFVALVSLLAGMTLYRIYDFANRPNANIVHAQSLDSSPFVNSNAPSNLHDVVPPPDEARNASPQPDGLSRMPPPSLSPPPHQSNFHPSDVQDTQVTAASAAFPVDTAPSPDEIEDESNTTPSPFHTWTTHETAVDALGRIGSAAVPALVRTLEHPNWERRRTAAMLLGKIGPDASGGVSGLVAALEDPHEEVRRAAARALGQIGPDASEAVEALLRMVDETAPANDPSQ